jgi:hypothetical protein
MIKYGIAVWGSELKKMLPGPNINTLIDSIEESKKSTGGFHPHVANRIFSTIMSDWKYSEHWQIPTHKVENLWKIKVSINRLVGGEIRKLIIFKLQKKIYINKKFFFSGTFSAQTVAFHKDIAIKECALSMLRQFYMARIIPSDFYYRRDESKFFFCHYSSYF